MGKKKRKTLAPVQQTPEPASLERFLRAYGELTDATAELYRRLDPGDPRRQQVYDSLGRAQRVAQSALDGGDAVPGPEPKAVKPAPGTSLELVRTPRPLPEVVEPAVPQRPVVPDESSLVRYTKTRRERHRWPDQSTLGRYLRERPLPDESSISRFRRKRREHYNR